MPAALILTLDAALDGCLAAVTDGDRVVAEVRRAGGRGSAASLPDIAGIVLRDAGIAASALDMIAVTVGPGSFTGVRAALALAHGIGLAAGVAVVGVSVGESIRAGLPAGSRPVWVAIDSRRGRVFLDDGCTVVSVALTAVPDPAGPIALAGDAAIVVACRLAARGHDVHLLDIRQADAAGIARGATRAGRAAVALYVDPVEARPGSAARPPPA